MTKSDRSGGLSFSLTKAATSATTCVVVPVRPQSERLLALRPQPRWSHEKVWMPLAASLEKKTLYRLMWSLKPWTKTSLALTGPVGCEMMHSARLLVENLIGSSPWFTHRPCLGVQLDAVDLKLTLCFCRHGG